MSTAGYVPRAPLTAAVRQALQGVNDYLIEADLLFLEAWELHPSSHLGAALRVSQIRRANPGLAEAIRAEFKAASKSSVGLIGQIVNPMALSREARGRDLTNSLKQSDSVG
jgi:hypothetical protein